ncbi:MAG: hypothetical protein JRN20_00610 [Nitrososphaerota archaeon]|nr:hypothetical protein [Nitrososphaerota archaeon]MDG6922149.1 hypothetical protein [Nitrososphaerota archaeon]
MSEDRTIDFPSNIPSKKALRVKIEFTDQNGAKYSFNVEGSSKDNLSKLMDLAENISGTSTSTESSLIDTNFARLYGLLESRFQFGLFTSKDVLQAYEQDFEMPTTLSVISTYLSRLANRGMLTRTRHGSAWVYKLTRTNEQRHEMMRQTSPNDLIRARQISP